MSNPLRNKSLLFAFRIVKLYEYLTEIKKEFVMSKQLLKAGTNPGAMVRESEYAQSGKDFINKLEVGQKEINETLYWLELLQMTGYLTQRQFESIHKDGEEILKLLTSSIKTKKKNMGI